MTGLASNLNIVTLLLVLAIAIGATLWFFRKPKNRNPMGDAGLEKNHPVEGFDKSKQP